MADGHHIVNCWKRYNSPINGPIWMKLGREVFSSLHHGRQQTSSCALMLWVAGSIPWLFLIYVVF